MRRLKIIILMLLNACATPKKFLPQKICSPGSLQIYQESLKNHKTKVPSEIKNYLLTKRERINQCYLNYSSYSGVKEFETCLVLVFDDKGEISYKKMSSQQLNDRKFFTCADETLKNILRSENFKNTSILQSYNFFTD